MFRKTEKYQEALNQFTKVMEQLPEDKTVYIERGLVYQNMGNHHMAIKDFQHAIQIDSRCVKAYYHNGTSKLKDGQIEAAIMDFKKAEDIDSTIAGIMDGLGQCYHAQGDYENALMQYDDALKARENDVEFLKNRSATFYDLKKYDESARDLDKAL